MLIQRPGMQGDRLSDSFTYMHRNSPDLRFDQWKRWFRICCHGDKQSAYSWKYRCFSLVHICIIALSRNRGRGSFGLFLSRWVVGFSNYNFVNFLQRSMNGVEGCTWTFWLQKTAPTIPDFKKREKTDKTREKPVLKCLISIGSILSFFHRYKTSINSRSTGHSLHLFESQDNPAVTFL